MRAGAGAGAGARGKVTGEVERRPEGQLNMMREDGLPTGTGPRSLVHTHTRTHTLSVAQVQAAGWKEDFSADYMPLSPHRPRAAGGEAQAQATPGMHGLASLGQTSHLLFLEGVVPWV